ncbi:hypothetical protein CN109_14130 [Sinorhizobium meliloti]|nr:hypothetical protein [Sinorhizobium meliloti]RVP33096.1 hypothetical protein CN109_14130 [Sinorhizobium meliloti]
MKKDAADLAVTAGIDDTDIAELRPSRLEHAKDSQLLRPQPLQRTRLRYPPICFLAARPARQTERAATHLLNPIRCPPRAIGNTPYTLALLRRIEKGAQRFRKLSPHE